MHRVGYRRSFDPYLLILPVVIFCIGLFFLYSASLGMQEIKGINFTVRQITWFALSLITAFIIVNVDYRRFLDWSYLYYLIIVLALFSILFIGGARMGARRWLAIGSFTLQPSEFAKLVLIVTLAQYLSNNRYASRSIKVFFNVLLLTAILFILIPGGIATCKFDPISCMPRRLLNQNSTISQLLVNPNGKAAAKFIFGRLLNP